MLELMKRMFGHRRRARELHRVASVEETNETHELKSEYQRRVEDQRQRVEHLELRASVKGRYEDDIPSEPR